MLKKFSREYLDIINSEFLGLNLTRIESYDDFYLKQVLDSTLPFECMSISDSLDQCQVVLDIGFGGGFPLLPLALINPEQSFIGLEAREKKVKAVRSIASKLNILNVSVHHLRSEGVLIDLPTMITFKAVGMVTTCLKLLNVAAPCFVLCYKGPNYHQEEQYDAPNGWKLIAEESIELPGVEGRVALLYENVPRGTFKKYNKKLVKLSELI
ncbi:MAG: hypothetical protein HN353_02270 [Bdellovibrionales bacterium]|nr:hypothetical protein [Bdellovibrionales bacterium]MBT3525511.1 hypothetical protein [Bdellovibrionales bacterium]MBT7669419.1 hypothetical protein [Bdellovibrionales bacterium]MBT7765601.1 hypothetical protein [Bdellovibrionales bacterium]